MSNSTPILQLNDLTVGYNHQGSPLEVIQDINMQAIKGELICFMGPNGVGKSTVLRTICGLQKAIRGHIKIDGQDISKIQPAALAQKISLVLTDRINAGNLSGYELIALGRYPYLGWNLKVNKDDQQQIDLAIAQTHTGAFAHKKIFELSDGQLQKIMIARALAQDTPIMILDEPTAHLDLNNRVAIVNLLKQLAHKSKKTIIMATHELDLALQTADKLWLAGSQSPIIEGMPEDLVINGAIDRVFQLKGYDLKTGTLSKDSLGHQVSLQGEGHLYLWTKNALERNGFEINSKSEVVVEIKGQSQWHLKNEGTTSPTLESLINQLKKNFNIT